MQVKRILEIITNLFVVWVLAAAVVGYHAPTSFLWFQPYIVSCLGVIMFGMGITLTPRDFRRVMQHPKAVCVGLIAQFLFMPALGFIVGNLFGAPPALAVGLVLVGSCPGGTASNVISYLAKADVALSVTMTALSTVIGVVATPLLTKFYAGHLIEINAIAMIWTVTRIVLIPVIAGLIFRLILKRHSEILLAIMPLVSVVGIVLIVGCIVALSANSLAGVAIPTVMAVTLQHIAGASLGFWFSRAMKLNETEARTIAIEVATQDSGLGIALARKHFAEILVALPSAIYSIWQNIAGPALALYWSRKQRNTL